MNKNYLIFAIVASALLVPAAYVTATIQLDLIPESAVNDADTGFANINGTTSVDVFYNSSVPFAIVTGAEDDAITVVNLNTPANMVGEETHQDTTELNGAHDVEVFNNANGTFAITANRVDNSVTLLDLTNFQDADGKISQAGTYDDASTAAYATKGGRAALTGAYDVAVFLNMSAQTQTQGEMAIVASHEEDAVQIINLRSFNGSKVTESNADTWSLNPIVLGVNVTKTGLCQDNGVGAADCTGTHGPRLVLDGPSGVDIWYDHVSNSAGIDPYAIVVSSEQDGFQILQLTDPMNSTGTSHIADGGGKGITPPYNSTGMSPYSNATDGNHGYNLLDGAMDVVTYNTTNTTPYAIIVSNVDDAMIIIDLKDPTFSTGGVSAAQVSNRTASDAGFAKLDGANNVDVVLIENRPYAVITSNATIATGGFLMVDVYDASNPLVVDVGIADGDLDETSGKTFTDLAGARDVDTFFAAPYHYAIVVEGESDGTKFNGRSGQFPTDADEDDSGIQLIRLSNDVSTSSGGLTCGLNKDCEAPSITKHGNSLTNDGFSINGQVLENQSRYNENDTIETKVGQLVTFKARVHDSYSISSIERILLYFDMPGTIPAWENANAAIKYNARSDSVISITDNNDIFDGDVSAKITTNPYGDDSSLKMLDVSFKVMFTEPMETSHIAIQSIDESGNYQMIYFKNALKVTGQSTGPTDTVGEDEINAEVTQTIATVPEWVKNTAGWWAEGQISEQEFVKGVEFLIKQQIIDTDVQTTTSEGTGSSVPEWVKNTAGWWAEGQISENEFVSAIEHLVKTGTIIVI